ncbi:hypothetical protein CSUI_008725 [Cystoisospora suis]|uniref:Uncharacterized protein n=1 Tax=Cystoisospora suis TaxID=483139 RepID=A0A2C6KM46_9APIC|nr:hypothetical protein CSUI_008725 [Cystoisospora suis]
MSEREARTRRMAFPSMVNISGCPFQIRWQVATRDVAWCKHGRNIEVPQRRASPRFAPLSDFPESATDKDMEVSGSTACETSDVKGVYIYAVPHESDGRTVRAIPGCVLTQGVNDRQKKTSGP